MDLQHLLRDLSPRVLGVLVRRYGDFGVCEDAVQEALLAAATQWPTTSIPLDPLAWLIRVASRKLTDEVRATSSRRQREGVSVSLVPPEEQLALAADEQAPEEDPTLDLLFVCCHPALSEASAIALTLRAVGGLTTFEIARAFLIPETTMAQRISRAKQTLRDAGFTVEPVEPTERSRRLKLVLHVLYLIFNEGYTATLGVDLRRTDLTDEAIRLTRWLHHLVPERSEVAGLLALMLLTDARRLARTGPRGEVIPLDEQDRSLWNREEIDEGVQLITRTLPRGELGPYQIQAAIAALHDEAPSAEETDWPQILALYSVLLTLGTNPMVALNHTIALAMVEGAEAGLRRLDVLEQEGVLPGHYRLDAVRGHLLERLGDLPGAIPCYVRAADKTTSLPERNYLLLKAAKLRE